MDDSQAPANAASGDDEDDSYFDPRDAADVLTTARIAARRSFEQRPPVLSGLLAIVVLAAYGTLWLSVRGQDPYVGPSLPAIGTVFAIIAVSVLVSLGFYSRATNGVRSTTRTQDAWEGLALGVPWLAVFVFDGALKADGFPAGIVYGVVDAAAPWLVVGAVMAGLGAARRNRARLAIGLGLVVAATVAAFFGPTGCWGILALCGFVGLLTLAVVQHLRLQRP